MNFPESTAYAKVTRRNERRMRKAGTQKLIFLLLALAPTFGGYLLFNLYPNLMSAYYSLLYWDGLSPAEFVGLKNYTALLKDENVWRALSHNLFFVVTVPPLTLAISLLLAYLLAVKKYKESGFYKVLYFFPNVLSTVVVSLLWAFVYNGDYGLLNAMLRLFGIPVGNFYWLGDTKTAIWSLLPPYLWATVGFYNIILMNAIISIPKPLYEAAVLEGASHMTRLYKITIPLVMPVIRVSALFLVLGAFQSLESILVLTNGGPAGSTNVIGLYMFNIAFGDKYHNYGYAAAIGMFLFLILVVVKLMMDKWMGNKSYEY
ncbi:carbohydrate ABC transporter permease [Paenibacillus sp. GCM10027626]|uniref:carbohydrate ABC transporter permease n=1 Tax=Paenibacillus sp. GCM10027626 TaxID=3273411 RepID=UPI003627531C